MNITKDVIDFINVIEMLESKKVDAVTTEGWLEDRGEYITLADDQWGKRLQLNSPQDSVTVSKWNVSFNDIVKIKFIGLKL